MKEALPGVYHGMVMEDYLALPAVSSGVIRETVQRCPAAGWFASYLNPHRSSDWSKASDAGTIAHCIALEGHADRCQVIDPADYPAEKTGKIPDGWTTKAIRDARDAARAAGKIPVLKDHWSEIEAMADAVLRFIASLERTEPAVWQAFQGGGASEVTVVWQDGQTPCRLRADRLSGAGDLLIDLKFARNAHPDAFARAGLIGMGYAMSAAFYRRGLREFYGVDATPVYIVTEQDPPHLCSLVGMDPSWIAYADAKVAHGMQVWQRCVERGTFPSYPNRAAFPELPPWEMARLEEQEIEAFVGSPVDYAKLSGLAPA